MGTVAKIESATTTISPGAFKRVARTKLQEESGAASAREDIALGAFTGRIHRPYLMVRRDGSIFLDVVDDGQSRGWWRAYLAVIEARGIVRPGFALDYADRTGGTKLRIDLDACDLSEAAE